MLTLKDHLERLPEGYRLKALFNAQRFEGWELNRSKLFKDSKEALAAAFVWHHSKEGFKYWYKLFNTL